MANTISKRSPILPFIEEIQERSPSITLGIGGRATQASSFPEHLKQYAPGNTKQEWEQWLRRIIPAYA